MIVRLDLSQVVDDLFGLCPFAGDIIWSPMACRDALKYGRVVAICTDCVSRMSFVSVLDKLK